MEQERIERDFQFVYGAKDFLSKLTVPIQLPLDELETIDEIAGRIITIHKIPCYVEKDLKESLKKFVNEKTIEMYDEIAGAAIEKLQRGEVDIDQLAEKWANAFMMVVTSISYCLPSKKIQAIQGHEKYAPKSEPLPDVGFPEIYNELIHSAAQDTLLNLEHTYAMAVKDLIEQRDKSLKLLEETQSKEMEHAVKNVDSVYTDAEINRLASKHFEDGQSLITKWNNQIKSVQDTQKREFREWISKVHEDMKKSPDGSGAIMRRIRAMSDATPYMAQVEDPTPPETRLEESFTVHLGAQMKIMHNLRFMCVDALDLCHYKPLKIGGVVTPNPQHLQTAMSLYSNNLSGLVLLVDERVNSYTGLKRKFAAVCQQSTDFHFPDLDTQLRVIQQHTFEANAQREENGEDGANSSKGSGTSSPDKLSLSHDKSETSPNLKIGDFYITRHSNLAEVHIVFHLVADERIRSPDLNSQHPTVRGLRNILKIASQHDVKTVTIPLLLVYEMSEEMTINWCLKRAELILKCVKGFLMEMTSMGGSEPITVQFIVPKNVSEALFSQLGSMIPQIFRESSAVDLMKKK